MGTSDQTAADRPGQTPPPPLLVVKGSRVREYLQQNQELLAAPVGAVTRTRYNQTWVTSRVDFAALEPGRAVVILVSDSPYRQMCPVRHARLRAATREGSYLDLVMSIEEFIDPEAAGRDCGASLLAAARAANTPVPFDDDGRKMFVDLAPLGWNVGRVPLQIPGPEGQGPPPSLASSDHSEILAWRRTIDFFTSSAEEKEHYAAAFFFRPVSLRRLLDDRTADARDNPMLTPTGEELMWPGEINLELDATYRLEVACYNPHRTADEVSRVRLSPDGAGRFSFPDPLGKGLPRLEREGLTQLHVVPRRAGSATLELSVTPGGETSSFVRLDTLRVLGSDEGVPETPESPDQGTRTPTYVIGEAVPSLEAGELLRLDHWIEDRL